jgi:hypothetical protein
MLPGYLGEDNSPTTAVCSRAAKRVLPTGARDPALHRRAVSSACRGAGNSGCFSTRSFGQRRRRVTNELSDDMRESRFCRKARQSRRERYPAKVGN